LVKTTATFAISDTLASHAGWVECVLGTDYTGNRPAWTPGTITGTNPASIDNSAAKATFTMLTSITLLGAFLCDSATGTGGTLHGEAALSPTLVVQANYVVTISIQITSAAA
jgi:hypothetical protein